MESIGESDGNSYYVDSNENSPTSPANTPYLVVHISELKEMYEFLEGELDVIARLTVLFSRTNELKFTELANSETNLPENHQYNGTTPPVRTQHSPMQSHPEDTSVASDAPSLRPHVEAGNAALQAR